MELSYIKQLSYSVFANSAVRKAYVFGSFAREDNGVNSDLDILVELDSGKLVGMIEFIQLQMKLEELFGRKVDLVSEDGLSRFLAPVIFNERKLIYEA